MSSYELLVSKICKLFPYFIQLYFFANNAHYRGMQNRLYMWRCLASTYLKKDELETTNLYIRCNICSDVLDAIGCKWISYWLFQIAAKEYSLKRFHINFQLKFVQAYKMILLLRKNIHKRWFILEKKLFNRQTYISLISNVILTRRRVNSRNSRSY